MKYADAFQFIKDVAVDWRKSKYLFAEPGDYLAVVAKRNGSEEYMELYGQDFERLRLPATGYEPRTFEVRTKIGEGVHSRKQEASIILPAISIMANLSSAPLITII